MKSLRLCAVGAVAALALVAAGPAGAEASDNASCVGQFASDPAPPQGREFGQFTANGAQVPENKPFGRTQVSQQARADREDCPPVGPPAP